jgi:hypothetical protein
MSRLRIRLEWFIFDTVFPTWLVSMRMPGSAADDVAGPYQPGA